MDEDLLLLKAEAMNRIEVTAWGASLTAWLAGDIDKARTIFRTGGLAEHYRAQLHEDPGQITEAQSAKLTELLDEFNRALELVGEPPAPYP